MAHVNKFGQWVGLDWDYSIQKCSEYVAHKKKFAHKYLYKGGDTIRIMWRKMIRTAKIEHIHYVRYDSLLGRDLYQIVISIGSRLICFNDIQKLKARECPA